MTFIHVALLLALPLAGLLLLIGVVADQLQPAS